jgi:two-component system sensor histidine kinase BaeS
VIRPLDRLGSLKLKLGVLVAASVGVASTLTAVGLSVGVAPRYTIAASVLIALLVTQLLARGMTSPLREMTAAARRMATGDYSRRVRATSGDEVGELGRAFNAMAAELATVDKQRRDLVANVSHELRTPVSALQAVLENLVDGVAEPDEATLQAALQQTERLGRLVTDLLDLSRVDAGITPLVVETVDVELFLNEVVAEARLAEQTVDYVIRVDPPDMRVHADRSRLHQLVGNLLDNAARHSPPGGAVTVEARAEQGGAVLEVTDEGPGIAPADRSRVFERFTTSAAQDGGTGLGLAIARWVTQLHGGLIEVAEPDRPGQGCRIRATFPEWSPS